MRKHGKVDSNQSAIVATARACGAFVQSLASVGDGCPDLLVLHRGRIMLWEVKDGGRPLCQQRLTDAEQDWHNDAAGVGVCIKIVTNNIQALAELSQ